jgi:hypothetical protein
MTHHCRFNLNSIKAYKIKNFILFFVYSIIIIINDRMHINIEVIFIFNI